MAVQTQFQFRRGTAAQWTSANPTLAAGEFGWETDTGKGKIGDGTTAWTSLAYSVGALSVSNLSGLGAGVATWLATPSSANLLAAMTDETGTGALVFANSPALTGNPTATTQASTDNSTRIATTAYVTTATAGAGTFVQAMMLGGM